MPKLRAYDSNGSSSSAILQRMEELEALSTAGNVSRVLPAHSFSWSWRACSLRVSSRRVCVSVSDYRLQHELIANQRNQEEEVAAQRDQSARRRCAGSRQVR